MLLQLVEVDLFLCDSLATSKKIKYVACHHEQQYLCKLLRFHNKPSLAMVTTGPGGTNTLLVLPLLGLTQSVIFISGQIYVNQQLENQKLGKEVFKNKYYNLIKPITKYSVMVKNK